jgi:hypothetical protein
MVLKKSPKTRKEPIRFDSKSKREAQTKTMRKTTPFTDEMTIFDFFKTIRRKLPPATSGAAQIRKLLDALGALLSCEMWAILTSAEQAGSAVR